MKHAMQHALAAGVADSVVSRRLGARLTLAPLLRLRSRLDSYTNGNVVGVRIAAQDSYKAVQVTATTMSSLYESNSARSAWTGAAVVRAPSRGY